MTRDSATQLTGVVAKNTANLTSANEPFDIVVTNDNGLSVSSLNAITIDASPYFNTASGTLGTLNGAASVNFQLQAVDPESGAITFNLVSGSLPSGVTLNNSTGLISGTAPELTSTTTYTFTIRVNDASSNFNDREFSIIVNATNYFGDGSDGSLST